MNLKNYAELRSLTLAKVKGLCKEVFDKIPTEDLTDEQLAALDSALAQASRPHLPEEQKLALPETTALTEGQQSKITEIVGTTTLKRHALIYQQILIRTSQQLLLNTAVVLEKTRAAQSQMLADHYGSLGQNLMAIHQEFVVPEDLTNSDDFFPTDLTEEDKQSMLIELKMMGLNT